MVTEALDTVGPLVAVEAAAADAAEAAARLAEVASGAEVSRSRRVVEALDDMELREERRWHRVLDQLETASGSNPDELDDLARGLELDAVFETQEAFGAAMEDDDFAFRLGPPQVEAGINHDDRLARVAHRKTPSTLKGVVRPAADSHDCLSRATHAGLWVETPNGEAVLLGDGSCVGVREERIARWQLGTKASTPSNLRAFCWADDQPPTLEAHAAAALAACLATRSADAPEAAEFPLWLTTGAAAQEPPTTTKLQVLRQAVTELKGVRTPGKAVAPLLRLAFEVARLRVARHPVAEVHRPTPVIDVGRVRWCELQRRPIFWLPVLNDHPDTVGGADRAWTSDLPGGGATWHGTSPGLRLDPAWSAALVVVPGDANLWCLDGDGAWWSMETDYAAIVLARLAHRKAWCDAMTRMHEAVPVRIERAEQEHEEVVGPARTGGNEGLKEATTPAVDVHESGLK